MPRVRVYLGVNFFSNFAKLLLHNRRLLYKIITVTFYVVKVIRSLLYLSYIYRLYPSFKQLSVRAFG